MLSKEIVKAQIALLERLLEQTEDNGTRVIIFASDVQDELDKLKGK